MPQREIPPWLATTFARAVKDAGGRDDEQAITAAYTDLVDRWSGPGRYHHNVKHLAGVLTRVGALASETHNVSLVILAAFYHGAVFSTKESATYRRHGGENEQASATLAYGKLSGLGVPTDKCATIANLITGMKTKRQDLDLADTDLLALRDAHMGSLAAEPQRYVRYLDEIGQEYAHIPRKDFLLARRDIVSKLLGRKHLFVSPLGTKWESEARQNLHAELERIDVALTNYTDDPGEPLGPQPAPRPLTPEEYRESKDLGHGRTPNLLGDPTEAADTSTLESVPDEGNDVTPEQSAEESRKKAERADIERRLKQRLAERTGVIPQVNAPVISAATPEWIEDDEVPASDAAASSSIEKEPE